MKFETKNFTSVIRGKRAPTLPQQPALIDPARDWMIILSISTLCFVVGAVYTAYDFHAQLSESTDAPVGSSAVSYPAGDVVRYAETYDEREAVFQQLRTERYTSPILGSAPSAQNAPEARSPLAEEWIAQ